MAATISICIPCYKSERYIRTTIESALAQTVPADEILISDDNSPDRSYEIISEYREIPGIRIIRPSHRISIGEHYRFLLEHAKTDYVSFLSSDDALMPSFVKAMREELEDNIGLIAAASLECNEKLIPKRARGMALPKRIFYPPEGYKYFTQGNVYIISTALFSREILLQAPVLPREGDLATDWYWAMMAGLKGKVKFVRKPLGYYRVHGSNAGHGNEDKWRKATAAMLNFLSTHLDADLSQNLCGKSKAIQKASMDIAPNPFPSSVKLRIKDSAKRLVSLRYRLLPKVISKAEQGIGVALERTRYSGS
ncbi:MAG TPA: glycosyltransferase [Pseudacidobacterium sp.]|jgi:glycosyltransferase involved in cell wall biosynthesis|nr:glycosyltransferase [Pseudacidobacterium sp.]